MSKILSIIVPHYREKEKDVFPLLSSINNQLGIKFSDIEVIISSDGGAEKLDITFLNLFNFEIKEIKLEKNLGPGVARQKGLDAATGEYVIFCDADDVLHNVGVLGVFIQEAMLNSPDIASSSWLEEIKDPNGNFIYIEHEIENTWMHGKMLKRQFLIDNNIKFHDELRVHEDSYFLSIAAELTKNRRHIQTTTYVWKFNENSITRRNNASYTYTKMPDFVKACTMAQAEVEKRVPEAMENKIIQFVLYNYFVYHTYGWQMPENKKYLISAQNAFVKYIKPFWHYWQEANPETIAELYNQERERTFSGNIESETIWEWIKNINLE